MQSAIACSASKTRRVMFVLTLGLFLALSTYTYSETGNKRTALVIGNARYEAEIGKLRNTNNDARAVAQGLRRLGFSVIERHDLNRDQFIRTLAEFRKTLPAAEVAVFYYAGHGISIAGSNYLIPVKSGFNPGDADSVTLRMMAETRLFNAEQAVADMSAGGAVCNLVILDACRNTPLTREPRSRGWTARAGLLEMAPPSGSLIAFATDAGQVAYDGDNTNGLYTEELLKHMLTPGLTIEQVFKRTRAGVVRRSEGIQIPAEYSRLIGDDIYLAGKELRPETDNTRDDELPSLIELSKFAASGQSETCIDGLKALVASRGPGAYAAEPLELLLEKVKGDLKLAKGPSPKVDKALETCDLVLQVLPEVLPTGHPRTSELSAKAHNRRGDALLLLDKAEPALEAFTAAAALTPEDSYIIYNRGRAYLALNRLEEARADFKAAADPKYDQPGARRLAQQALADLR